MESLKRSKRFEPLPCPVVMVIMDGIGDGPDNEGNAVRLAHTPTLDTIRKNSLTVQLAAHGTAVGMPSRKDMGNSEVGHNAIGAGRIFDQGAKLVRNAIESGRLFEGEVWKEMAARCVSNSSALHLIGLLSDGNVHSHIDHVFALVRQADREGVKKLFIHPLLDGRDVSETSALEYVEPLEALLAELRAKGDRDYRIASGGGRMRVTMDRYFADWRIVERGWNAHVHGKGRSFASAKEAILTYREEEKGLSDQFLPEFVVAQNGQPVGRIQDGDCVVYFNFRGDRAIEISMAFENDGFEGFDRGERPDVYYAGMMQYDGDLLLPRHYLVLPPHIEGTVSEHLVKSGVRQLAISETQKFGHVTYFWNGNRSGKFDETLEKYIEIPSDRVPFEQRPWMKAAEITDALNAELRTGQYAFLRLNLANGDMVGHTGDLRAARLAVETVDLCLERILQNKGIIIVTADHGNSDEMFEVDPKTGAFKTDGEGNRIVRTSHTLNPVPFIIVDPSFKGEYRINDSIENPGLSNIAATLLLLMGYEPPEDYDPALIT